MASTYSTNLKIELQGTGENPGTWGTITNTNLGTALEQAIVGYGNPAYASDANLTLTYTNTNAAQTARSLVLNVTSSVSLTATRELVVPTIQKQYIVQNNTTGAQSITVKTSAGTGITVPNGRKAHLYVDGTNVIQMFDFVDINGGAIDGTPVGASSASTGAFTTLAASSTATFSGLTASTALALDGSKNVVSVTNTGTGNNVLATSPTLTTPNLGTPSAIVLTNASGTASININGTVGATTPNTGSFTTLTATTLGGALNANSQAITNANIDSGTIDGVTIGGASAGAGTFTTLTTSSTVTLNGGTANGLLYLNGSKVATSGSAVTFDGTNFATTGTASATKLIPTGGTATGNGLYLPAANTVALSTDGTERLRVDSSGNLGLGVTPSAWSGGFKATQYPGGSVASYASGTNLQIEVGNAYYQSSLGTYTYYNTGTAPTLYRQISGEHRWLTAPSGTAGNAITFTQAMTLDTSANLSIGTTAAVASGTGVAIYSPTSARVQLRNSTTGDAAGDGCGLLAFGYDLYVENRENGATLFFNNGAERMRLDASGDLGVGETSPGGYRLAVKTSGTALAFFRGAEYSQVRHTDGTRTLFTQVYNNVAVLATESNTPLTFGTNNTERMRLDASGRLGLGTTSPSSSIEVATGSGLTAAISLRANAVTTTGEFFVGQDGGNAAYLYNRANSFIAFGTNNTERMRLDASGNLGLGVTPSASGSTYGGSQMRTLTVQSANIVSAAGYDAHYAQNAYRLTDGSWRYQGNGGNNVAHLYSQATGGSHIWYTAPSGTAGNAITFTQAMTLSAGGQLFVGTTSGSSGFNLNSGAGNWFTVGASATSGSFGTFYKGGTSTPVGYIGTDADGIASGGSGDNFGIRAENALLLMAGAAERARIDSSGNLLVGTTATIGGFSSCKLTVVSSAGSYFQVTGGAASTNYAHNTATTGDNSFLTFGTEAAFTTRGSIDYNRAGGLVRYNTTSDYRAKDIIGPVQDPGATIDALKVYEGKMKDATQSRPMLIAHEAQEHAPYAVSGVKDEVNEDGTPKFQQIDVSSLVPLLLAEIQSLRTRVASLENR